MGERELRNIKRTFSYAILYYGGILYIITLKRSENWHNTYLYLTLGPYKGLGFNFVVLQKTYL